MAETVYLRGENGVVLEHKLPLPDGITHRMTKGYITRVNADGSTWTGDDGDQPQAPAKPSQSATKAEWVGYAVSVDPGLSPDDADAMTKADLIEKYGK